MNRLDSDDDGANGSVLSRSRFISEEIRHSVFTWPENLDNSRIEPWFAACFY